MTLETLGIQAKQAERELLKLNSLKKNACLMAAAKGLVAAQADILKANAEDVRIAREKGMKESLVDRLALTEERIASMAEGLASLVALRIRSERSSKPKYGQTALKSAKNVCLWASSGLFMNPGRM